MSKNIRIAIAGVGNCTSALVQAIHYYKSQENQNSLWHKHVGDYLLSDIEVVDAFDVNETKIGKDLSEAIFDKSNQVKKLVDLPLQDVVVQKGINNAEDSTGENIISSLKKNNVDVFINLISSGFENLSSKYSEIALEANCNFINATTADIAINRSVVEKYESKNLIIAGDDLLSQIGGTIFHKGIINLLSQRGVKIEKSYQLDVGGGEETLRTIDENVRGDKRKVKTDAIQIEKGAPSNLEAGTTDFVEFLGNKRTSYFAIYGSHFLGSDVTFDIYQRSNDGPNGASVLVDIIRAIQHAKSKGKKGNVNSISNFGFKKLLEPMPFAEANSIFEKDFLK